uniref:Putative dystrophin-like protein n=1 Tax=Ixodes ricinus TaxID=34613 RepID=A0A6B0VD18_IXORI
MDDWERQETGAGIPYYVSHRLEKTQWDHPEMVAIMDKLTSFNDIKYAAYRTGAKLICLQKELLLSNVHVSMLPGVFGSRGLEGSGQQELLLGCSQAEAVLEELYRRAPGVHQQKVPLLAALALNLLQNLFDAKRKGTIQVVQMKVALFVLCAGRLLDKLKYMCGELQDGSQRIPLEGLEAFLHNISKVPELLGEKLSFGAHLVPAAVESCRKLCSQPSVPSDLFLGWLLREPQNLVWISTFYRMRSTENVAHPVKCGACKASPVVGLRYQCLQCLGYDLCQSCFLHGMISKNHSIKHRMQEHCQQTSSWEKVKAVLKTLSLKLQRWKREPRPSYLPLQAAEPRSLAKEVASRELCGPAGAAVPSSPVHQRHLQQHLVQVEAQLRRMRALLQVLSRDAEPPPRGPGVWLQSTPMQCPANGTQPGSMDRFVEIHRGLKALEAPLPPPPWEVHAPSPIAAAPAPTIRPAPWGAPPHGVPEGPSLPSPPLGDSSECSFGDLTCPSAHVERAPVVPANGRVPCHPLDGELESILRQLDDLLSEPKQGYSSATVNVMETVNQVQQVMDRMKQGC